MLVVGGVLFAKDGFNVDESLRKFGEWTSAHKADTPRVAATAAGALLAASVLEYVAALPLLNLLFPPLLQALGVATVALAALRYGKQGKSAAADMDAAGKALSRALDIAE